MPGKDMIIQYFTCLVYAGLVYLQVLSKTTPMESDLSPWKITSTENYLNSTKSDKIFLVSFCYLHFFITLNFRTSMGEDMRDWIECSDTEYDDDDDDTTDSDEEWHEVKDYDLAWGERGQEE